MFEGNILHHNWLTSLKEENEVKEELVVHYCTSTRLFVNHVWLECVAFCNIEPATSSSVRVLIMAFIQFVCCKRGRGGGVV